MLDILAAELTWDNLELINLSFLLMLDVEVVFIIDRFALQDLFELFNINMINNRISDRFDRVILFEIRG